MQTILAVLRCSDLPAHRLARIIHEQVSEFQSTRSAILQRDDASGRTLIDQLGGQFSIKHRSNAAAAGLDVDLNPALERVDMSQRYQQRYDAAGT